MNDEINGARDVTKTNTLRVETFRAPELGVLGYVDEDRVSFYRMSTRRHTINSEFDLSSVKELPPVEIAYSYVEPSSAVLQALVKGGARGIVFAGTGAGSLSSFERAALKEVLAVPPAARPVLARGEYDALGILPADTLNPQKARILLMLALTRTADLTEIRRMFAEY
jgi:L-asparaginase